MIRTKNILKQEVNLVSGFNIKDLLYFLLVISLNLFLLVVIKLNLASALFTYILILETIIWVLLKSLSIKAYDKKYYLNKIFFYFRNMKHSFKEYSKEKNSKYYSFKNLINLNFSNSENTTEINKSFSELIKNIYYVDPSSSLRFRLFINSESKNDFFPVRELILEVKANHNLLTLEKELRNFAFRHSLDFTDIAERTFLNYYGNFFHFQDIIKERKEYVKSKQYISSLGIKSISDEDFSLIEFIKKIQSKTEFVLEISFAEHEKLLKLLKFKQTLLETFNLKNLSNQKLLAEIKNLSNWIREDEMALKHNINLKFLANNPNELKNIKRSFINKFNKLEFYNRNSNEYKSFIDKDYSKTFINLEFSKKLNPFIEERISMQAGIKIGIKADDNSVIDFNLFNKNYSNNYSINFIGDSGSGKSLAAKLLMRRLTSSSPKNKFIIIDSSLHGWEKIVENLSGEIEDFSSPNNKNLSIKEKQINLYNFYKIEKNIQLSQKLLFEILNELKEIIQKQDANYFLIIDEAWKLLINEESKASSKLLSQIARTGRSMNIGLWTISQKPKDINSDIHSNASNSFIFQIKDKNDKETISKLLSLKEKEIDILNLSQINKRGFALMRNQHFATLIKFIFEEKEFEFLNSENLI